MPRGQDVDEAVQDAMRTLLEAGRKLKALEKIVGTSNWFGTPAGLYAGGILNDLYIEARRMAARADRMQAQGLRETRNEYMAMKRVSRQRDGVAVVKTNGRYGWLGESIRLEDAQRMVGGTVAVVRCPGRTAMLVCEEGLPRGMRFNPVASAFARRSLVGDVLLLRGAKALDSWC